MRVLTLAVLVMLATAQHVHAAGAAVPEPGTLTMVGVGAVAIGAIGWWRSRRSNPGSGLHMRVPILLVLVMLLTALQAHVLGMADPEPASLTYVGVGATAIGAATWWNSRRK